MIEQIASDQEQIDLQSNRLVDDRDQPALRRTLFTRHADRIVQMNIGRMQYMSERRHESRLGLALSDLISTDRHHRLSCFMDLLFTLNGRGAQGGRAPGARGVRRAAPARGAAALARDARLAVRRGRGVERGAARDELRVAADGRAARAIRGGAVEW